MTGRVGLKSYVWKDRYSSAYDDLIEDFYVHALSRSRYYYRISAYFTTSSIINAFKGVTSFVENGEKIRMIVGNSLTAGDMEALSLSFDDVEQLLERKWSDFLNEEVDDYSDFTRRVIGWLLAHGKLEIKVAVNTDSDGRPVPSSQSIFHEKVLIFEDHSGEKLQLDGSINETVAGWGKNRESFSVHRSWEPGQSTYVLSAQETFDRLWNDDDSKSRVYGISEAIRNNLIELAAPLDLSTKVGKQLFDRRSTSPVRELRNYQSEAIEAWKRNGCIGVLEMATGTGKTYTSLMAMDSMERSGKVLVIVVPQKDLALQWSLECKSVWGDELATQVCDSDHPEWKRNLAVMIRQTLRGDSFSVVISTMATLRSKRMMDIITENQKDIFIIIDEVHEMGSQENRKILENMNGISFRMGLSATPTRLWDSDGNQALEDYFGGPPVFRWGIEQAINPPEGYVRCLSEYKYYFHTCSLDVEELEKYRTLSARIAHHITKRTKGGKVKLDLTNDKFLSGLLRERANIIKKCENRFDVLDSILDSHPEMKKCLIYCNDIEEIDRITRMLMGRHETVLKYYGIIPGAERSKALDTFNGGNTRFLVAVKCLDQGVDLPICDSAIILTSCKNPREYVQRRGRVLRIHHGKEYSSIHDVIVLPYPIEDIKEGAVTLSDTEMRMVDVQVERIKMFIDSSLNRIDGKLELMRLGNEIGRLRNG